MQHAIEAGSTDLWHECTSTSQWSVKNQEQTNVLLYALNTNYTHTCRWPATAHGPGHVVNVSIPSSFSPSFIYYIQIKELRRHGAWLLFVSLSFILILYCSCLGEELEMRSTMLG